jgi:ubiquitin-like protein 4
MSAQAEAAFVRTYLNTIGSQSVTYADDFQQAPEATLKKVPLLPVRTELP